MNGKPIYYYNGKQLTKERFFRFKGEGRVEGFLPNGERVVVPSSEVTTERPESQYIRGVVSKKTEQPSTLSIEESEKVIVRDNTTEPDSIELDAINQDLSDIAELEELESEIVAQVVEDSIEVDQEEESEFNGQPLLVDDLDEDTVQMVYGSEEFITLVEEHNLDTEAIDRILRDEQKTHKGFSFTLA